MKKLLCFFFLLCAVASDGATIQLRRFFFDHNANGIYDGVDTYSGIDTLNIRVTPVVEAPVSPSSGTYTLSVRFPNSSGGLQNVQSTAKNFTAGLLPLTFVVGVSNVANAFGTPHLVEVASGVSSQPGNITLTAQAYEAQHSFVLTATPIPPGSTPPVRAITVDGLGRFKGGLESAEYSIRVYAGTRLDVHKDYLIEIDGTSYFWLVNRSNPQRVEFNQFDLTRGSESPLPVSWRVLRRTAGGSWQQIASGINNLEPYEPISVYDLETATIEENPNPGGSDPGTVPTTAIKPGTNETVDTSGNGFQPPPSTGGTGSGGGTTVNMGDGSSVNLEMNVYDEVKQALVDAGAAGAAPASPGNVDVSAADQFDERGKLEAMQTSAEAANEAKEQVVSGLKTKFQTFAAKIDGIPQTSGSVSQITFATVSMGAAGSKDIKIDLSDGLGGNVPRIRQMFLWGLTICWFVVSFKTIRYYL